MSITPVDIAAAAAQGDAAAQFKLGLIYDTGHGVPQDVSEAIRWYRAAAEQGHATAQFRLGNIYQNGYGVPQDTSEAIRWYRAAAEQGDAAAQNNLGLMYKNGEGVPQDASEAVRWFRAAAEQGDDSAQFNLGLMYKNGEGNGVIENDVAAYMWFDIASANGHQDAIKNRDIMADRMTSDAIAEAQSRARICMESDYQDCG